MNSSGSQKLKNSDVITINYRTNNESYLLESLKAAFDTQVSMDFVVVSQVDGQQVRCHKLVLTMCSKFFEHIFVAQKYEKSKFYVPMMTGSMLRSLISFMYDQKLIIPAGQYNLAMEWGQVLCVSILKTNTKILF